MSYSQVFKKSSGDLDALIDGSITSITSDASSIADYAFYNRKSLKTASFPNATSIGKFSFAIPNSEANILESINAPNVTTVDSSAFIRNEKLEEINFPKLTNISDQAFNNCKKVHRVNLPEVTTIGTAAFGNSMSDYYLSADIEIDFPKAISIGASCFYNCGKIKSINLPNVTSIGGINAFSSCSRVITINLPKVTTLQQGTFNSCTYLKNIDVSSANNVAKTAFQSTGLEVLDLPKVTIINEQGFKSSIYLVTLILRSETVATLDNINAFDNTPFASGKAGGTLYVPQALISSYQSANNWSTILGYPNNSIQAIEGSIYE